MIASVKTCQPGYHVWQHLFSLTLKITIQVDLQLFLLVFIGGNIEYCSIVNEKQRIFYSGGEKNIFSACHQRSHQLEIWPK
jgi:hypothetical protein